MYRYLLITVLFLSACVDPTPPKVIDLRSPDRSNYVELTGVSTIQTWGAFIDSLCSQSGRYPPRLYNNYKNLFFRVSLSADTLIEAGSNDDYIALSPFFDCGYGCIKRSIIFTQIDDEIRINGEAVAKQENLKRELEGFYQLDTTLPSIHPYPENVRYRIDINFRRDHALDEGLALIKKVALTYLDLKEEYPGEIPKLRVLLGFILPPPPPPSASLPSSE